MSHVHGKIYNFTPESYTLPNDYLQFIKSFSIHSIFFKYYYRKRKCIMDL